MAAKSAANTYARPTDRQRNCTTHDGKNKIPYSLVNALTQTKIDYEAIDLSQQAISRIEDENKNLWKEMDESQDARVTKRLRKRRKDIKENIQYWKRVMFQKQNGGQSPPANFADDSDSD